MDLSSYILFERLLMFADCPPLCQSYISFTDSESTICLQALIPLGNKVIIDYTIEYLLEQGIQEIIIFCCSLGEKIREHVK